MQTHLGVEEGSEGGADKHAGECEALQVGLQGVIVRLGRLLRSLLPRLCLQACPSQQRLMEVKQTQQQSLLTTRR